jgi:hypothetical protein
MNDNFTVRACRLMANHADCSPEVMWTTTNRLTLNKTFLIIQRKLQM